MLTARGKLNHGSLNYLVDVDHLVDVNVLWTRVVPLQDVRVLQLAVVHVEMHEVSLVVLDSVSLDVRLVSMAFTKELL